jgi:hypothetical protein
MRAQSLLLIATAFLTGCSSWPRLFTPEAILLKDPEYRARREAHLREEQRRQEAEAIAEVAGLLSIRTIYLGDFGNGDGSALVREKVRTALASHSRFQVIENPNKADAILTGVAGVERHYRQSINTDAYGDVSGSGGTSYSGIGVLRLVDVKKETAIWNFEYSRGFMLGGSVSSRVANQIVDKLISDARRAEELSEKGAIAK